MNKEALLKIINNNSKHPNCAITILEAVEKYIAASSQPSLPLDWEKEFREYPNKFRLTHAYWPTTNDLIDYIKTHLLSKSPSVRLDANSIDTVNIEIHSITIEKAATDHALEQLGEDQFNSNQFAATAIKDDFKAGVHFIINLFKSETSSIYNKTQTS